MLVVNDLKGDELAPEGGGAGGNNLNLMGAFVFLSLVKHAIRGEISKRTPSRVAKLSSVFSIIMLARFLQGATNCSYMGFTSRLY